MMRLGLLGFNDCLSSLAKTFKIYHEGNEVIHRRFGNGALGICGVCVYHASRVNHLLESITGTSNAAQHPLL